MKIAICDDNTEYIRLIAGLVAPYKEKYQMDLKTFESGEEFLKWDEPFDIIFLDIEMKTVSGIDVAAKLRAENDDAIIIFITSHTNYVSDTFRLGAFQYLTKPFTEADFKLDFERAINTYMSKHKKFAVRFRDEITLLECQDIFFIEAYDRHLHIITSDKQYECVGKLTDKYEELKVFGFARCHQGFLVNVSKIKRIEKNKLIMDNASEVPISRKFKTEIVDAFNLYMAGESL